jgi:protein-S-isoprenylcysteine O-methyltransferase Ste14
MGKIVVSLALAGLLGTTAMHVGGMLPLVLILVALIAYSLIARQRATLSASADEVREARARVAAQASPYDLIRHE